MCVNLCKTPVQTFFTEELGMPLTMKPNFEDYRCAQSISLGRHELHKVKLDLVSDNPRLGQCLKRCKEL